ncbi:MULTISPECIES: Rrf2 family transcriptional regulator [unclassified Paenibacillus]|uniref:Rrf2 family transcriptional regulator n=1 Tax=unclassified Paenibacillus TaxID=185978 RepID=UPI001049C7B9|nr:MULTISPECIES: Rrf2 family transcriptional regulator [unclassified Paenibacillus]TCM89116.1 BadM/Rrf2 family transcriptional regulator [Paenibacillus sp. BK033]
MQYSVGVEYALHCLVYLIPNESTIGIKELAFFQGIPETYLSKIFTKLTKAGIVSSVPGVKGGFKLARDPDAISFWDVVEAVEGKKPIFQCQNIKDKGYVYRNRDCSDCTVSTGSCSINLVMLEAEETMQNYLRSKKLSWLEEELDRVLPAETRKQTREFFAKGRSGD